MYRAPTKTLQAACALALAATAHHAHPDTVELTNGDLLTGTVTHQTDQAVTLDHAVLGEITLQAKRIAKITLDRDRTDADTTNPTQAQPASKTPPTPDTAQAKAAALKAATRDRTFLQGLFEDWNNKLTLGLNGSAGPTDRQDYRVKFTTDQEDGRKRWNFDTSWYYAKADGDQIQNQFQTNLTKDWLQKDAPWFFFVKGQYKFDDNRSWENRTSAFGGGGYTLTQTQDIQVNTRLGFGGTYEYGSVNEFTPEALFGGSVVQWNLTDRAALAGQTLYYPSLDDSTQFRVESSLEWTYRLDMADDLSLKLGVENEYDSRTPNEDANNDIRYYGAVVLSF